jgi:hypothetical protein
MSTSVHPMWRLGSKRTLESKELHSMRACIQRCECSSVYEYIYIVFLKNQTNHASNSKKEQTFQGIKNKTILDI